MKITCMRKEHQPTEFELHRFCVEASDLGIKAGQPFPRSIDTDLGNGQPFQFVRTQDEGFTYVYAQQFGCTFLHVFND